MKYTIVKVTMGNGSIHYKLRHTKWHRLKYAWKHMTSNAYMFSDDYDSYEKALRAIRLEESERTDKSTIAKENYIVHRTKIPHHLPADQRLRYISTEKLTEKGDL